jgi:hypothetical protein
MKNLIIAAVASLLSFHTLAQDFWEPVIIPDSVSPGQIAFNSQSDIYLSTGIGLYKSADGGESWFFLLEQLGGLDVCTSESDEVFVGVDSFGNLFHSIDNGFSWDTINTGADWGFLRMVNDSTLYILNWGNIYRSSDYGASWTKVLSTSQNVEIFQDLIEHNDSVYAGATHFLDPNGGGIYRGESNGNNWEQISLPGYGVSSLCIDQDNNLLAGVRFQYHHIAFGVFRSYDNGYNWNQLLSGHLVTCLLTDFNGSIYAGCDSDFGPEGIQLSTDNGNSWTPLNSGLHEDASIEEIEISPLGYIYTITDNPAKVYRSVNPIVGYHDQELSEKKITFYPNPCTNKITVRLDADRDKNTICKVQLINILGTVLYEDVAILRGNADLILDVSFLAEGTYFLILENDQNIYTTPLLKFDN